MKPISALAVISLGFLAPLHGEEKSPVEIEEKLVREAEAREGKKELRVGPQQALKAKQAFIRVLEDLFRDPNLFLSTRPGGGVVLPTPLTAERIQALAKELEANLRPSGKSGRAEWLYLSTSGLSAENYSAVLLAPDFSNDPGATFQQLKLTNEVGDIAELALADADAVPQWTSLVKEIQSAIAERDAKEASRPEPMTVASAMEQASQVIPRMDLAKSTLGQLHDYYRSTRGGEGDADRAVAIDLSLIPDLVDQPVITMREKDITWSMVWSRAADAVGCDLLFGRDSIRFVPRTP